LIIDEIFKSILCDPEFLETLCPECHGKEKLEDYNDLPF
jgi:hypothetical protein